MVFVSNNEIKISLDHVELALQLILISVDGGVAADFDILVANNLVLIALDGVVVADALILGANHNRLVADPLVQVSCERVLEAR